MGPSGIDCAGIDDFDFCNSPGQNEKKGGRI